MGDPPSTVAHSIDGTAGVDFVPHFDTDLHGDGPPSLELCASLGQSIFIEREHFRQCGRFEYTMSLILQCRLCCEWVCMGTSMIGFGLPFGYQSTTSLFWLAIAATMAAANV